MKLASGPEARINQGVVKVVIADTATATGSFLYPVAVAVSAITTLTTPWLIRASGPLASFIDRKLPKPLQTFATLYGSWIERMRESPRRDTVGAATRRWVALLLVDMALLAAVIVGSSFASEAAAPAMAERIGSSREVAAALVIGAGTLLAVPFLVGVIRIARKLGSLLAQIAFPERLEGRPDLAAAPRRALFITLELGIVLLVALPILAITQPFTGGFSTAIVALALVVALAVTLWNTATHLEGHVRAGAQMGLEVRAAQSGTPRAAQPGALQQVDDLLPGIGAPESLQLDAASSAAGKTLSELNLRGLTGATVLAIQRGDVGHSFPAAHEVLQAGDVLALAGTEEAIAAARELLAAR